MQDAAELGRLLAVTHLLCVAPFDVDAQLFLQDVDLLVERQTLATEEPRLAKGGTANHHGVDAIAVEGLVGLSE